MAPNPTIKRVSPRNTALEPRSAFQSLEVLTDRVTRARGSFLACASIKLNACTAQASAKTVALLDTLIWRLAMSARNSGVS